MAGSQKSFESRIGKFRNGVSVIQTWADYLPSNPSIQKATLVALVNEVETKNTTVTLTQNNWLTATDARKKLYYYDKQIDNRLCYEMRLGQITNYVNSLGDDEQTAYEMLRAIQKKFMPGLVKKKIAENVYRNVVAQNRTFNSVSGFLSDTIAIISNITAPIAYNPPDPNTSIAAMQNLSTQMQAANSAANTAHVDYLEATQLRREAYNLMSEKIILIKNYLASFDGARKSNHYLGFVQALKG